MALKLTPLDDDLGGRSKWSFKELHIQIKHLNMAYKPTRMDRIKKIVEYHQKGYGKRRIASLLGMSKNTVKRYLDRIEQRGIVIDELDSPEEQEKMYQRDEKVPDPRDTDIEDRIPQLLKELGRVGVTRYLLWEEYITQYPDGFSYSRF